MPSSSSFQNSRFNSRQIANRLVARAVIPQVQGQAVKIAEKLVGPLDHETGGFFRALASHMGKPEDLVTQVPGVPGAFPWNPLNLKYIRAKGTAAFWLFILAPKVVASRNTAFKNMDGSERRSARKNAKTREQNSLITTFSRMDGNQVFGGASIKLTDEEGFNYEVTRATGKFKRSGRSTFAGQTVTKKIAAYKIGISIRLWSALQARELSHVEAWLLAEGKIGENTLIKLVNPRGYPRPLIRPWMAYYSQVLIPGIIRETLRNYRLLDSGNVHITGNRASGAL